MGINQFLWLEREEGYGQAIMQSWNFDKNDLLWIFSHTGVNAVNIDVANEAHKRGMKVIVCGSAGPVTRNLATQAERTFSRSLIMWLTHAALFRMRP